MCASPSCPAGERCYRNARSGTKPSEYRQSFFLGDPPWIEAADGTVSCGHYWPREVSDSRLTGAGGLEAVVP